MIKFSAHGQGCGRRAVAYLLRKKDSRGAEREEVAVLRGDPELVERVIERVPRKWKYTSGVIAWAPGDEPTDRQIERVLDEFEQTAWAGLGPERYAWCAVLHRAADGTAHVHVLAARTDLQTGKDLNIAPPGWERVWGPWRDWLNITHGWKRPDVPQKPEKRGRAGRDMPAAELRAAAARARDPRRVITRWIERRMARGDLHTREDALRALRGAGYEVTRAGEKFVSVRDPNRAKAWRLKAAVFQRGFDVEAWMRGRTAAERRAEASRARAKVFAGRKKRAAANRAEYGPSDREGGFDAERWREEASRARERGEPEVPVVGAALAPALSQLDASIARLAAEVARWSQAGGLGVEARWGRGAPGGEGGALPSPAAPRSRAGGGGPVARPGVGRDLPPCPACGATWDCECRPRGAGRSI